MKSILGFERKCKTCGKVFVVESTDWVYKIVRPKTVDYCCSYSCYRKLQKKEEERHKRVMERANERRREKLEQNKLKQEQENMIAEMMEQLKHMADCMDEIRKFEELQKPCTIETYGQGFYNGLEFALAMLEKREPVFISSNELEANIQANTESEQQVIKTSGGKVKL